MTPDEAFAAINKMMDEWNKEQPFLLFLNNGAIRNIRVKPRASDGWQRFIAIDSEFTSNEGPFGFGETERKALEDLVSNSEYKQLLNL